MLAACLCLTLTLITGPVPRLEARFATATLAPTATALPDADGDGTTDRADPCPDLFENVQSDLDADGWGDLCDKDIDGDGVANASDPCPFATDDLCLNAAPHVVHIANPALSGDLAQVLVSYISLVTFELSTDNRLPILLNGVVYGAGDEPLWADSGNLQLTITFESPTDGANPVAIGGGTLTLLCPADGGGQCAGSIVFDLVTSAGRVRCEPNHARCAWTLNALKPAPGLMNVWGRYDHDSNRVLFATGLPVRLGDAFTAAYDARVSLSDGREAALTSAITGYTLPYTAEDNSDDCLDGDDQAAACPPSGDLQSAEMAFLWLDSAPYLSVTIKTAQDIPITSSRPRTVFDFYLITRNGDDTRVNFFDFGPTNAGRWQMRRFQEDSNGRFQPANLPPGITFAAQGNTATLMLPLSFEAPHTIVFHSLGARTSLEDGGTFTDSIRSNRFESTPLIVFIFPDDGADVLPLIELPLYDQPQTFHTFLMLPFPEE